MRRGVRIGTIISVKLESLKPERKKQMQGLYLFRSQILCLGLMDLWLGFGEQLRGSNIHTSDTSTNHSLLPSSYLVHTKSSSFFSTSCFLYVKTALENLSKLLSIFDRENLHHVLPNIHRCYSQKNPQALSLCPETVNLGAQIFNLRAQTPTFSTHRHPAFTIKNLKTLPPYRSSHLVARQCKYRRLGGQWL